MNNCEQIVTTASPNSQPDEKQIEPVSDLIEIEAKTLADVAGGPDGTAIGNN